MHHRVHVLGLALAFVSSSCEGNDTRTTELQLAPEPAPIAPVPPEVARMISRIGPNEFRVDRQLLGLLARPAFAERRRDLDGQIVFRYFDHEMKLSPEKTGDNWAAPRLYLDLEARIERRQHAARAILQALGVQERDFPGDTSWDRAMAARDRAREWLEAAMKREQADDEFAKKRAAFQQAFAEVQRFAEWTPRINGSLPALLGFADLDRIERVNDVPVRSYGEIYDVFAKLGTAERVDIDVVRRDTPIHLTYHIVSDRAGSPDTAAR